MYPKIKSSKRLLENHQRQKPISHIISFTNNNYNHNNFNSHFFPLLQQHQHQQNQTQKEEEEQSCSLLFPVGSEVEVTSDEEGFKDAWYLATVIPPPLHSLTSSTPHSYNNKDSIFIEYKTLLSEENKPTLLREQVDVRFVRPKPPIDEEEENGGVSGFEVNDVVDAYFQDGWWTGVVTGVFYSNLSPPQKSFSVFFSNPPHELRFGRSDLRIHRNWVDGNWVLPPKQRMSDLSFSPGTAVEVNIDLESSGDVWFPATFIKQVYNSSLVEYQSSKDGGLQKVAVDSLHIRPSPPSSDTKAFNLLEKVDAFCDCRWLSGVVTKILADGKYIVYFKRTKKEKELSYSDLRLHMEWSDGRWVLSSQDTSKRRNYDKRSSNVVSGNLKDKIPGSTGGASLVTGNAEEITIPATTLNGSPTQLQSSSSEKTNHHSTISGRKRRDKRPTHPANGGLKVKIFGPVADTSLETVNFEDEGISTVYLKTSQPILQSPSSERATETSTTSSSKRIKHTFANGDTASRPSKSSNEEIVSDAPLSPEACQSTPKQMEGSNNGTTSDLKTLVSPMLEDSCLKPSEESSQPSATADVEGDDEGLLLAGGRGRPRRVRVGRAIYTPPPKNTVVFPSGTIVVGLTHDGKMIPSLSRSLDKPVEEPVKAVEGEGRQCDTSKNHENVVSEENGQQKDDGVTNLKRKRGRPPKVLFHVSSPMTTEAENADDTKTGVANVKDSPEVQSLANEVVEPDAIVEATGISDSILPTHSGRQQRVKIIGHEIEPPSNVGSSGKRRRSKTSRRKHWKSLEEADAVEIDEPVKSFTLRKGRKHKSIKQVDPPLEAAADSLKEKAVEADNDIVCQDVATSFDRTLSNLSDDDRPLSTWLEGAHSPLAADARVSLPGTTGESEDTGEEKDQNKLQPAVELMESTCEEKVVESRDGSIPAEIVTREKKDEPTPTEIVARDDTAAVRADKMPIQSSAIVSVDDSDLPFAKNSLIWQMIESMEVLKRIPQKPHFRPLFNCKEECREGLAIGSMVTFTSLVERISRLQFSDPKSLIDGYLGALVDLDDLGFNVAPVREQLNTLLSIKEKYEHAKSSSIVVEAQMLERNDEKARIDGEVAELDKKIAELNEKRALAVSQKEAKETEIANLQSSIDVVNSTLGSVEEEFVKVAASLW